jgi:hypothetical protein
MRAFLLASATAATSAFAARAVARARPARSISRGIPDDGYGANDQQLPEIAFDLFGDAAQAFLSVARILTRQKTNPCCKVAARYETLRIADRRHQRTGEHRANARDPYQTLSGFGAARAYDDAPIRFQYLSV